MKSLHIHNDGHRFQKVNLVTIQSKKGHYDLYACADCGIKGKRRGISEYLEVDNPKDCSVVKPAVRKVEMRSPYVESSFGIKLGTILEVHPPPAGEKPGVWVWCEKRSGLILLRKDEYTEIHS